MSIGARVGPTFLDAADEVAAINVRGQAAVGLQLAGTWSGTVTFECKIEDADTWVTFNMVPSASATAASTATANGVLTANCAALEAVRARFSTATAGTVRATLTASQSAGRY